MAIYTSIRCKIIVKDEYRTEINRLFEENYLTWEDSQLQLFKDFGGIGFSEFLPYGGLNCEPFNWKVDDNEHLNEYNRTFDVNSGFWWFLCSINSCNYCTIDYFINEIIPEISSEVIHFEVYSEAKDQSTLYELVHGQLRIKSSTEVTPIEEAPEQMSYLEAIEVLNEFHDTTRYNKFKTALSMAITALENEYNESENNFTGIPPKVVFNIINTAKDLINENINNKISNIKYGMINDYNVFQVFIANNIADTITVSEMGDIIIAIEDTAKETGFAVVVDFLKN